MDLEPELRVYFPTIIEVEESKMSFQMLFNPVNATAILEEIQSLDQAAPSSGSKVKSKVCLCEMLLSN